jgi:hypothetical protein
MSKYFLGKLLTKAIKSIPRSKKVSPDIKSVPPTKLSVSKSIQKVKDDEYRKRYTALDKAQDKLKTGKKMMKEGQEERKKLVDTKKAFQFKNIKSYHAVQPGNPGKIKLENIKKPKPDKRFYTGKELEQQEYFNEGKGRKQKASGGRVGLKAGTNAFKRKTNIDKIKETFAPKKRINAKGGFPDLSGDGKTTFKDILIGRGVIKKKNGKNKKKVI